MKHLMRGTDGHIDQIDITLRSVVDPYSNDSDVFIHAVLQGLADIEHGRYVSLAETKERLGLS